MSATNSRFQYSQGSGYRIYHKVLAPESCTYILLEMTLEICFFVFRELAVQLVKAFGLGTIDLIADRDRRQMLGIPDNLIRRNGNPRESKVLKKSGKTTLVTNVAIRDRIRRNPRFKDILSEFYGNDRLAYTGGLDNPIFKPKNSHESPAILDCKFHEPLQPSSGLNNPFHYTSFACVSNSNTETHALKLLQNFDVHFENIKKLIRLGKPKKHLDITILDNLNVEKLNDELKKRHNNIFGPFKELQWVNVNVTEGDFVVFDCRLPYKTGKSDCSTPILLVPVSLRPVSKEWYQSIRHTQLVASITTGRVGDWSKKTTKGCNNDEVYWRNSEHVLPKSKLSHVIDIKDFTDYDNMIFGLKPYPL